MDSGDGVNRAILLLFLSAMRGGPLLIDHPEYHLDYRNKMLLARMLITPEKQTIITTHAAEWMAATDEDVVKRIEIKG